MNPVRNRLRYVLSGLMVLAACSLMGFLAVAESTSSTSHGSEIKANKYVGAKKCKNCHQAEKSGDQYGKWEEMRHSKAYETLASDKAKEFAKERGIADPQKADECLKCHVTAYEEPEKNVDKRFDPTLGVQCESCHGPGDGHVKARFQAALKAGGKVEGRQSIPADEIVSRPDPKVCLGCHNEESPGFDGFCFRAMAMKIKHWDPRQERTEEEITAWKCTCEGDPCKCQKAECGGYPEVGGK